MNRRMAWIKNRGDILMHYDATYSSEVSPKTTAVQQSASLQGAGDLDYPAPVFSAADNQRLIESLRLSIYETRMRAAKLERDLAKQHEEYRLLHGFASMMLVGCIVLLILQFR